MRRLALAALVVALGIGSLLIWHAKSQVRYERNRLTLEWQAAKLAEKIYSVGAVPDAWDTGLFLSDKGLLEAASTLKGMRLTSQKDNVTLTVDSVSLRPNPTFMEVEIALSANSSTLKAALKVRAVAELVFAGTVQKDDNTAILRFTLVPIEILPEVAWFGLDWKGSKLASDLIAGEILTGMIASAPIELPVPNGFAGNLGGERTGTLVMNKDLASKLTYSLTVPSITLTGSLPAVAPLFLKDGLWLLTSQKPITGLSELPNPVGQPHEVMVRETNEIRAKLRLTAAPAGDAVLWVGSEFLMSAVSEIVNLPLGQRRVAFRSTKVSGLIAKKDWRDDILGNGGAFAEFVDDNAVTGTAIVSEITPKWIANVGLDVSTRIDAHADAKVHVHVDPLIGGGVGTSVGLVGDASASLGATVAFTAETIENTRVLVVRPIGRCGSLDIALKTDGTAKTDFGWTKLPSIGIIRHQPVDISVLAPFPILDDLPRAIDGRDQDGKARVVDLKTGKVTVEPAWRYLNAKISVVDAKATASGWLLGAQLNIVPAERPAAAAAFAQQRDKIRAAVAQTASNSCTEDGSTEITFGDVVFGPNNEIVKFLVSVGKITQQVADKLEHEGSKEKVKEWIADPTGSFERSDPGKAAETVRGIVAAPIEDYCDHNWCPHF